MDKCNPMYAVICDVYSDEGDYGSCQNRNICLADLLGEKEMLRKCEAFGLDKIHEIEYTQIRDRIYGKGGEKENVK